VSFHVQNGAKFIGTNPDKYTMIAGYKALGNGSMIKCVEEASGVTAEIAGKPNPFILEYLIKEYNLKK
jgi:ribonucleotide monophosphatase NagD (HAD superfamily)